MISRPIPVDCPRCGKALYPIAATRPQPALSMMGKLGFVIAGVISTTIYFAAFFTIREATEEHFLPDKIVAAIVLVPALLPGLVIGFVVHRLARVVRLRCSSCKWNETLPVPRAPRKSQLTAKRATPTMVHVGGPRLMPPPPDAGGEASYAEIRAWIYAEFVSGRTYDEIFAEMIEGGWGNEEAEALVEEGRKATRDRRP